MTDINANFSALNSDKAEKTLTVNSKALSTNPVLTTADVADSTNKRYVTDANLVVIGNTTNTNSGDQTLPVKAAGSDIDTATDDAKFVTSKALADCHNTPNVAPGTAGNLMQSNGTDWVSSAFTLDFKNGTITRSFADASGAVTTAHGLGRIPRFVRLTARFSKGASYAFANSDGVYNGTTNSSVYTGHNTNGATESSGTDNTNAVHIDYGADSADSQVAIVTFDATNITLTWTKAGTTTTGNISIMWEAIG